jgi:hypothetical protein
MDVVIEHTEVLTFDWARVTETGLVIESAPDYDVWVHDGRKVLRLERMLPWVIGDWVNYGENRWGDMYTAALEATDYSYSRLATFAYVCRRVEFSRRRQDLSFSHHEIVAPETPKKQIHWLQQAVNRGWSVQDLDDAIHARPTRDAGDVWWLAKLRSLLSQITQEAPAQRERLQEIVDFEALDALIKELTPDDKKG